MASLRRWNISLLFVSLIAAGCAQAPPGTYPSRLLWGDTHVHSNLSMDAHIFGNTHLGPDAAYAFAKGQEVLLPDGTPARLRRPLDFLVVADHAEYLGVRVGLTRGDPKLLSQEVGARWHHHMTSPDGDPSVPLLEFAHSLRSGENLLEDSDFRSSVWADMVAMAEEANEPGVFTALLGYEWSAMPDSNNLHRVVVFRDGPDKVLQHRPFSALDSSRPEDLWAALSEYEYATQGRVLTIPHNPNLSGGLMFHPELATEHAHTRAHFETVLEVTQVKGDSETHPFLSPDDEFADFERWDRTNIGMVEPHRDEWFSGEYARSALLNGLALEDQLGVNPFQLGLIGSSDLHGSLSEVSEDRFPGKFTQPGQGPDRWDFTVGPETLLPQVYYEWELAAAGYAGVWAHDNTREEVFDALRRRETYATTGPRIELRFFVSTRYRSDILQRDDWVATAYRDGHPMGSDVDIPAGREPAFILHAVKDPAGANLDRIQVVKGWVDESGVTREKVFDAVLSDPARRQADHIKAVGNTVDPATATYTNTIGSEKLAGLWRDPEFVAGQKAFYYLRVLEIPTPRWTTYATHSHATSPPAEVPRSQQERAYSSPVWIRGEAARKK